MDFSRKTVDNFFIRPLVKPEVKLLSSEATLIFSDKNYLSYLGGVTQLDLELTLILEWRTHTNTENLKTWVEIDPVKNILDGWNYTHDTLVNFQKYLKAFLLRVEVRSISLQVEGWLLKFYPRKSWYFQKKADKI